MKSNLSFFKKRVAGNNTPRILEIPLEISSNHNETSLILSPISLNNKNLTLDFEKKLQIAEKEYERDVTIEKIREILALYAVNF